MRVDSVKYVYIPFGETALAVVPSPLSLLLLRPSPLYSLLLLLSSYTTNLSILFSPIQKKGTA